MLKLHRKLLKDLKKVFKGVDLPEFTLTLKGYSSRSYGKYKPDTRTIVLYCYEDKQETRLYAYDHLLNILIHEIVHHLQWSDESWTRKKGIMHDTQFYELLNKYVSKMADMILRGEITC